MMNTDTISNFDDENGCLKNNKTRVWKFVRHEDFIHKSSILKNRSCNYNWLSISKEGEIRVKGSFKKGYAWDGCTPKANLLHITWGNFDGKLKKFDEGDYKPYTYYASMIHDVLYQYKRCAPITRREADRIFYNLLKESGFMWAYFYFIGVRLLGWVYCGWKYKTTKAIELERNN